MTAPREPLSRRLRVPALVLLLLATVDVGVRLSRDVWGRHSPDDYAARVGGCAERPRDFVLVGGSPVSEGLDPAVVAGTRWRGTVLTNGYAVGLPGGTTTDIYFATTHSCPTPPKLLVYGIAPSDLNDGRNEPHGPASVMTWADLRDLTATRPDAAEWSIRHFSQSRLGDAWAVYRYRHGIRMAAAAAADDQCPGCCPASAAESRELSAYATALRAGTGYAPAAGFSGRRYDEVKRYNLGLPPFAFLDNYRTGSHLRYLYRLLDWAADRGTAVVLLDMPLTADLEAKYPAVIAEYRRRLNEVETCRRVPVLRASRAAVGLGDRHFADLIHLNRVGAATLSAWLRDRLADPASAGSARP